MTVPESKTHDSPKGVLATDLDGTLIPLGNCPENKSDLLSLAETIRQRDLSLVFITGRHISSVKAAIAEFELPIPDWIICDVGTSVFRVIGPKQFEPVGQYANRLAEILGADNIQPLASRLEQIPGLRRQEDEKQGQFKLSYYVDAEQLSASSGAIAKTLDASGIKHELIASVDPFNGDGLIDILPLGVSKAFALDWWTTFRGVDAESVVFAGDSGNDLAAMIAGYKTIVVGNADRSLATQVTAHHKKHGWENRLCLSQSKATSGVLEGLTFFSEL